MMMHKMMKNKNHPIMTSQNESSFHQQHNKQEEDLSEAIMFHTGSTFKHRSDDPVTHVGTSIDVWFWEEMI